MTDATLLQELARDNVELHRRVVALEEQDRQRLSRIAGLKLEIADLRGEHARRSWAAVMAQKNCAYCGGHHDSATCKR
jgi:hypothetical protein